MKLLPHQNTRWLKRLLVAQSLVSVVAAGLVLFGGEYSSLGYSLAVGLLPMAIVVAYVLHVPYSSLVLRAYSAAMAGLGGLSLAVLIFEGSGSWLSPSRLLLSAQVAVAILLAVALSPSLVARFQDRDHAS